MTGTDSLTILVCQEFVFGWSKEGGQNGECATL